MNIHWKPIFIGLALGLLIALLVAAPVSFVDWRANPGGVFRDSAGTDWEVVFETLLSWLWPTFLITAPVCILVLLALRGRRRMNANRKPQRTGAEN